MRHYFRTAFLIFHVTFQLFMWLAIFAEKTIELNLNFV
jgi:hypothetical protein